MIEIHHGGFPPMTGTTSPERVHRTDIQLRFADTDALGHVNNRSFIVYAELARIEFMKSIEAVVLAQILAHISADFRKQVLFGDSIVAETWVERVGNTSVTLRQAIRANGAVAVELKSVSVCFDYSAQRPQPWPQNLRTAFESYIPGAQP